MDKLAAMTTFVEIVERGSLTAAASALDKSLPTVVRTLASLEQELGVSLLRRTTRRMSLTADGQGYLERCRQILHDVAEAEEALSRGEVEPRGLLRVTAPVRYGEMHVAPVVADFVAAYPEVKVELMLLDRLVNLVEEGVDVGVRIAALDDSGLFARQVGKVRRVVCASPKLVRRVGAPKHPRELAEQPCVLFRSPMPVTSWEFRNRGKKLHVKVDGPFCANQVSACLDACARGLGFGRFLSYQVAPLVASKRLRVVLAEFEPPELPINLVYTHAKLMSARVRVFLDTLEAELGRREDLPSRRTRRGRRGKPSKSR